MPMCIVIPMCSFLQETFKTIENTIDPPRDDTRPLETLVETFEQQRETTEGHSSNDGELLKEWHSNPWVAFHPTPQSASDPRRADGSSSLPEGERVSLGLALNKEAFSNAGLQPISQHDRPSHSFPSLSWRCLPGDCFLMVWSSFCPQKSALSRLSWGHPGEQEQTAWTSTTTTGPYLDSLQATTEKKVSQSQDVTEDLLPRTILKAGPASRPSGFGPDEPRAERDGLGPQGGDVLHRVLRHFHRLLVICGTLLSRQTPSLWAPASHWTKARRTGRRGPGTGREGAYKPRPLRVVNPAWQCIIPAADLKSAVTPPALTLLCFWSLTAPFTSWLWTSSHRAPPTHHPPCLLTKKLLTPTQSWLENPSEPPAWILVFSYLYKRALTQHKHTQSQHTQCWWCNDSQIKHHNPHFHFL